MATFLFDKIIFGPIQSRRLGTSLGINLLPTARKWCNYDCIYCECGWNSNNSNVHIELPTIEQIEKELNNKLQTMKKEGKQLDVITFAGNGEPTMHPQFAEIVDITIELKNKYFPDVKISVLTNSTMLHKKDVFDALLKVDNNICKLDTAIDKTFSQINLPQNVRLVKETIELLSLFRGKVSIQTLFVKGKSENETFDNTTDIEIEALINAYKKINPLEVMIYSISRDTPLDTIEVVKKSDLEKIAKRIETAGIKTLVA